MDRFSDIQRLTVGSSTSPLFIQGGKRVLIKVTGADIRIATDLGEMASGNYFVINDGETIVLDPDPLTGGNLLEQIFYAVRDATTDATVMIWIQGALA